MLSHHFETRAKVQCCANEDALLDPEAHAFRQSANWRRAHSVRKSTNRDKTALGSVTLVRSREKTVVTVTIVIKYGAIDKIWRNYSYKETVTSVFKSPMNIEVDERRRRTRPVTR